MTNAAFTIGSVLVVSAVSLLGAFILSGGDTLKRLMKFLVGISTGALLGNVFLHLLPESLEHGESTDRVLALVFAGLLGSFLIETFIHWRHCHDLDCAGHIEPVGPLILAGDAAHNVIDGILIATAYLVDVPLGIATTVAVVLHEIPQELGDFALLVHSGLSRKKALLWNFASALPAFLGVALVMTLTTTAPHIEAALLPLAAGNFLYIAGSDLIPELHKQTRMNGTVMNFAWILVGTGIMWLLGNLEGVLAVH